MSAFNKVEHAYSHPVLGVFSRERRPRQAGGYSYELVNEQGADLRGLGYHFPEVSFYLINVTEPSAMQTQMMVDVLNFDSSNRAELERKILERYKNELYPETRGHLLEEYSEVEVNQMLPLPADPALVWTLLGSPRHIDLGSWGKKVVLSFYCTFDNEHDIHLGFSESCEFVDLWLE